MTHVNLVEALTREHHDIDTGIESFLQDHEAEHVEPLLTAFEALRRHIYLEEEFLFPPIRQAGVMMPILVMLREHGELWHLMDELTEELANRGGRPVDDQVLARCRAILGQLDQHNSKEEPIIYPHAQTDLTDEAAANLAEFLQAGTMPADWVCEAVR